MAAPSRCGGTRRGHHWDAYVDHAFVRQLAAGSLPRDSFLHYLRQDYVFLLHFARSWALVFAKSDRMSEMALASSIAHGLLNGEMPLHVAICGREGITEAMLQDTPESPANMAYTRFVQATGYAATCWTCWRRWRLASSAMARSGWRMRTAAAPNGDLATPTMAARLIMRLP